MTQDEIIEMAQECALIGMRPHLDGIYSEALVAFAKLVADKALADHAMREVQRLGQEIEQDYTYGYASRLAIAIWQKHYMKDAPKWKPLDTTEGVLTQIDNMTCGLVKEKPAQPEQEPVAWFHPHKGFYWAKPTSISAPTIADVEPLPLYTHPPKETT
jgi:hypothetical protein